MLRYLGWASILLAASTSCPGQVFDGNIDLMPRAPFTANRRSISAKTGGSTLDCASRVARATNGSVYQAQICTFGENNGKSDWVLIDDATNNCRTSIRPFLSSQKPDHLGRMQGSWTSLQFRISTNRAERYKDRTPAQNREREQRSQAYITDQPIVADGEVHRLALGEKNANGTTIFGFRNEPTPSANRDLVSEWWNSDLGFQFSMVSISPSQGTRSSVNTTNLQLVEPDSTLFTIKDEYFPETQAILEAKSLFLDGFSGHTVLEQKIAEILTAPGRVSIVQDRRDADLVASLQLPSLPKDEKNPSSQIILKIEDPKAASITSWDLLSLSLRLRGSEEDWVAAPEINTCLSTVWTRIETERIHNIPPHTP
jgi:hypothetical protein